MKVFGLDFTSSPTVDKPLTLAVCHLDDGVLMVEELRPLTGTKDEPFLVMEKWLAEEPGPWIAGIDFPFGQPIEAIEHYGWIDEENEEQTWESYLDSIISTCSSSRSFKATIELWKHPQKQNKQGKPEGIRKLRMTDRLAPSNSPMNCVRPPVGQMFFEGARRIKASDASIYPVRVLDDRDRVLVEAYPRLVASHFIPRGSYKESDNSGSQRQAIFDGIRSSDPSGLMARRYGFAVQIGEEYIKEAVEDRNGDLLDSILCAIQAAWSYRRKDENYGIPRFHLHVLNERLALEGWIVDPYMLLLAQRVSGQHDRQL